MRTKHLTFLIVFQGLSRCDVLKLLI